MPSSYAIGDYFEQHGRLGAEVTKPNKSPFATGNIFKSKIICPMFWQHTFLHKFGVMLKTSCETYKVRAILANFIPREPLPKS